MHKTITCIKKRCVLQEPELMDFTKPLTKEEEDAQLADYIINYILKEKISDHTLLKNEVDPSTRDRLMLSRPVNNCHIS